MNKTQTLPTKDQLDALKVGDKVTRMLAGCLPMPLKVTAIDNYIHCGFDDMDWTFHRETGCEVDLQLGWDGVTKTSSFLKLD